MLTEEELISMIDKKVYRWKISCPCWVCKYWTENWVFINDKQTAEYLFLCQTEMWTNYFKTKEELWK